MQNNFDKLNEIFGVGKTEPEQKPDTAAEPEAPAAGAPAEEGGQEHGRADDETKILPPSSLRAGFSAASAPRRSSRSRPVMSSPKSRRSPSLRKGPPEIP